MPKRGLADYLDLAETAYTAYNQHKRAGRGVAASVAAAAMGNLMSPAPGKAPPPPPPPSVVLKGSRLKSYLDRTYQKKCGVEVKRYTAASTPTVSATFAEVIRFPQNLAIALGNNEQQRAGDSIEIKEVALNFSISADVGNTRGTRCKFWLVKCGQGPTGTVPTAQNLLWLPTNIRSGPTDKDETTFPYTVVKKWDFSLPPIQAPSQAITTKYINYTYRPRGCHAVRWTASDTTGAQGNIFSGALVLYGMFESIGGVAAPAISLWEEYSFTDV